MSLAYGLSSHHIVSWGGRRTLHGRRQQRTRPPPHHRAVGTALAGLRELHREPPGRRQLLIDRGEMGGARITMILGSDPG